MKTEYAIELHDVVKRFGDVAAVDHVDLSIHDGEFFSLLGPSGCGKTTTLRLIAGFEMPTQGQIFIGGDPQGYLPAYQRPVNTVFQHYALFPHMSVYKNVAFGLEMQKVDAAEVRRRVGEALEMVHLEGMHNRRPSQLSGGQQQRVAIARALVKNPALVLADEPTGSLDVDTGVEVLKVMRALNRETGQTFVLVTHNSAIAQIADRVIRLGSGKVHNVITNPSPFEPGDVDW